MNCKEQGVNGDEKRERERGQIMMGKAYNDPKERKFYSLDSADLLKGIKTESNIQRILPQNE